MASYPFPCLNKYIAHNFSKLSVLLKMYTKVFNQKYDALDISFNYQS